MYINLQINFSKNSCLEFLSKSKAKEAPRDFIRQIEKVIPDGDREREKEIKTDR